MASVGKVVAVPGVRCGEGTGSTACDAGDFPPRYYFVSCAVAVSYLIVVRQLDFIIVEVVVIIVLVCALQRYL